MKNLSTKTECVTSGVFGLGKKPSVVVDISANTPQA